MNYIPCIITDNGTISMMVDGDVKTVTTSHIHYDEIITAIKDERYDDAVALLDVAKHIEDYGAGKVEVRGGVVYYNGQTMHNTLTARILKMRDEGFDIDPLCHFLENLMDNPSKRSVDQLYGFLEKGSMPITEDGHFLAYKIVREDYTDQYSGKFNNSPGTVVEVPRNTVDEDPDATCSAGLHFCSQGYLGHYGTGCGSRVMIIKINPRDVVAIPRDYDNAKGRCCRYEVLYEAKKAVNSTDTESEFTSSVYRDGDETAGYVGLRAENASGTEYSALFTLDEAACRLCGDCMYPRDALRKRINRGSVSTELHSGKAMVRCNLHGWENEKVQDETLFSENEDEDEDRWDF